MIRSSALFGVTVSSGKGDTSVETIHVLGKERDELKVVNNQVFSPSYTRDLAKNIVQLISTDYYGIFHIINKGHYSWFKFAREILRQAGSKTRVIPISPEQYP